MSRPAQDMTRAQLQRQYDGMAAALLERNAKSYAEFFASGGALINTRGEKMDAASGSTDFLDFFSSTTNLSVAISVESVTSGEDELRARARISASGMMQSIPAPFPMRAEFLQDDTWKESGGIWRLTTAHTIEERAWNGDQLGHESVFEPLSEAEKSALVADVAQRSTPLRSVDAGMDDADLEAFGRMIGDARIVALGEATHGTSEFFRLKHRLFRYLVEKKGFTVMLFEQDWPGARKVDRFIKTGDGNAYDATRALFGVWATVEVHDMIDWMRDHNASRSARRALSFAGFDIQGAGDAAECVTNHVGRLGPEVRATFERLYDGSEKLIRWTATVEEVASLQARAHEAIQILSTLREQLDTALSPDERQELSMCASYMLRVATLYTSPNGELRDEMMAACAREFIDDVYRDQKVVIWAHNSHVGNGMVGTTESMGSRLRETYRRQMAVVGFANEKGEVRARRISREAPRGNNAWQSLPLNPPRTGSLEALFSEIGAPIFVLDMQAVDSESPFGKWLSRRRDHRSVGWGYDTDNAGSGYNGTVELKEMYDVMIFVAQTTAAQPLNQERHV